MYLVVSSSTAVFRVWTKVFLSSEGFGTRALRETFLCSQSEGRFYTASLFNQMSRPLLAVKRRHLCVSFTLASFILSLFAKKKTLFALLQ